MFNVRKSYSGYPVHGPHCGGRLRPTKCRRCGEDILWYSCAHGSSVLFDTAAPWWDKHECW